MSKPQKILITVVASLAVLSGVAATSRILNTVNPEGQSGPPAIVPPLLAPPDSSHLKHVSIDVPLASPDGRTIAQLGIKDPGFSGAVSVDFPIIAPSTDPNEVSFAIISTIRYEGDQGSLLITTAKPSVKAIAQALSLGNKQITLANGREAWVYSNPTDKEFPNRVVFTERNLIVTLTGSVSSERLQELANSVAVK